MASQKKTWYKDGEDKLLLFNIGVIFGIAVTASMVGFLWYGVLSALAVFIILLLVEQSYHKKATRRR